MNILRSVTAGLYLGIAAFGLSTLSAHDASAVLIAADLAEIGGADTLVTRDTGTGLDWLDVPLTTSISFNDITGGTAISNGGALNGLNPISGAAFAANPFRHATPAELATLFASASIPNPNGGFTELNFVPVGELMDLLGRTFDIGTPVASTTGILASISAANAGFGALDLCSSTGPGCTGGSSFAGPFFEGNATSTGGTAKTETFRISGHFLVRSSGSSTTPVPEPGTLALFGLGLAGLGLARRRRTG